MEWLRTHPFVASFIGVVIIILIGAIIVSNRSSVEPGTSSLRAWGGVGANLLNPTTQNPNKVAQGEETLYTTVQSGPPFQYTPPAAIPQTYVSGGEEFDFESFLQLLSQSPKEGPTISDEPGETYAFIPTGFISTTTSQLQQQQRTTLQVALYNYANEAASNIQTYEEIYRSAPQILKNQFEDRNNPAKNDALRNVARGLSGVGNALLAMEEIPAQLKSAHERLGKSYQEMGANLSKIPDATTDQTLVDAMLTYNTSVEAYVKNYVALATLFAAHGVRFSADDPGSAFLFTNANTL